MQISKTLALITAMAITGTGCATILKSKSTQVTLDKVPAGTEVIVDGQSVGKAPMTVSMSNKQDHQVTFRATDGTESNCRVSSGVSIGWVALDIFGGLIGVVIDGVTGNWKSLDASQCSSAG
jgi:hypothetical protein